MTTVAEAYVDLHVNGDSIEGEVRSSIKGAEGSAEKDSDKVGRSLGDRLGAGFVKGFATKVKSQGGLIGKDLKEGLSGLGGLKIPALAALVPLATSGLSALSGALVAFTGAVVQASGASLAMVGVMGSLIQAKMVGTLAFKDFAKAVGGDEKALAALSPATREVARAAMGLAEQWGEVKKAVQDSVFQGLESTFKRIGETTLPVLRKGLSDTGSIMNGVFKDMGRWVTSEGFVTRFGRALQGNNGILRNLGKAAVPLLRGILAIYRALQPAARRLSENIAQGAKRFAAWANEAGRAKSIDGFMKRAFKSAGFLWRIFKNLGATLRNVFGAAAPTGDGILKTLANMTKRLADFTALASSKNAIAEWAKTGTEITGKLFTGLGKGFMLIKGLFDPSIFGGFLGIFEKVAPIIGSAVKAIGGALAPVFEKVGGALKQFGPEFGELFTNLAPLLKGFGSVFGSIIANVISTLGSVLKVVNPVIKVIAGFLGPIIEKLAPIIGMVVLSFAGMGLAVIKVLKFLGPLGKLLYGLLAPLFRVYDALYKALMPVLSLLGKVVGKVFGFIGKYIGSVMKVLGYTVSFYFKIIKFVITSVLKAVWAVVKTVWKGIWKVISGVVKLIGKVISFYFKMIWKVISTVMKVVWKIVSTIWKTIWKVIATVVKGIWSVISKTWNAVGSITRKVFTAIWNTVKRVWDAIVGVVRKGVSAVLGVIGKMIDKVVSFASNFLEAGKKIGSNVIRGISSGLSAAGGFLSDLVGKIKSAINGALNLPITLGKGPFKFTIPAFANGTNYAPGGMALVGERGPELVNLPRGSRVKTAAQTRQALGQRGSLTIQVNNPLPERAGQSVKKVLAQHVYEAGWAV